jgi:hypothetical protein
MMSARNEAGRFKTNLNTSEESPAANFRDSSGEEVSEFQVLVTLHNNTVLASSELWTA